MSLAKRSTTSTSCSDVDRFRLFYWFSEPEIRTATFYLNELSWATARSVVVHGQIYRGRIPPVPGTVLFGVRAQVCAVHLIAILSCMPVAVKFSFRIQRGAKRSWGRPASVVSFSARDHKWLHTCRYLNTVAVLHRVETVEEFMHPTRSIGHRSSDRAATAVRTTADFATKVEVCGVEKKTIPPRLQGPMVFCKANK